MDPPDLLARGQHPDPDLLLLVLVIVLASSVAQPTPVQGLPPVTSGLDGYCNSRANCDILDHRVDPMNTQAFYTIEEYASLVRIHPHTARQHYRRGLLRGIKIGNAIRIPVSEVERITSLTDPSSGPTTHGA